jgi:hypothetical protein
MSKENSPAREGQDFSNGAEPFVTERDAAEFLGISVRTLQRWRIEPPTGGAPPFYRFGAKRIVYRLSSLGCWAESRAFTSTAEADNA